MSLIIPQVLVGPNWRLRDHAWMKQQNVAWVLKYVDKQPPRIEEVDPEEEKIMLEDADYTAATVMTFDTVQNEESAGLPMGLLNHLPHGVGYIMMAKTVLKDEPERKVLVCSPKGNSRAPAVLAAVLILSQKAPAQVAIGHMMAKHPTTNISQQLLAQLGAFEQLMSNDEQKLGFYRQMSNSIESVDKTLKNQSETR